MHLLITGICGFVGSTLAEALLDHAAPGTVQITGIDNFSRSGSWLNRDRLTARGIRVVHGDIRSASDLESFGPFDWVIDAAANPSVLAGIDGKSSSRQLVENNLGGTINLLEACKRWRAGFILLSTSRVYSIPPLASLPVEIHDRAYRPTDHSPLPSDHCPLITDDLPQAPDHCPLITAHSPGISPAGISETFSTAPPVSLYGATKLTSESLALEYGLTFDFPVWINRCGVMAGARQFGKPDQGIFAFWIHSWREGRPLKYIGFDGLGHQVRDCLHPRDLAPLIFKQVGLDRRAGPVVASGADRESDANAPLPTRDHSPSTQLLPSQLLPSQLLPSQLLPSQLLPSQLLPSQLLPSQLLPSQLLPSQLLPSQLLPSQLSASQHFSFSAFPKIINLSGGLASAMSLRQLSDWCADRFPSSATPNHPLSVLPKHRNSETPVSSRPFDLPWVVLDHSLATETWNWQPTTPVTQILEKIATFADQNPNWIATSA